MSQPLIDDYPTWLAFIAQEAQHRAEDYAAFAYYVELDERSDAEMDSLVQKLAEPILAVIDCTQCANCCRQLDVYLTESDGQRLTSIIPIDSILTDWVDFEAAQKLEEWAKFRAKPCAFLRNNLCTIYPHRPESCRNYPAFTPDFRWMVRDILEGVGVCPIIYQVIEAVQKVLKW
jgi:hypothetical protein